MDKGGLRLGVKSIDVGIGLVMQLAETQAPTSLKDLAEMANMSRAKAHRYLVSFLRTGLVTQSPHTNLYELGPMAIHLGLAAMGQSALIEQATGLCGQVRDEIGETSVLTIWGNAGPTVIHVEESHSIIVVTVHVGTVLPILHTAAGRVFAAFGNSPRVDELVNRELANPDEQSRVRDPITRSTFEAAIADVRARHQAIITDFKALGVSSIASPLMFPKNNLVATLAVIGRSGRFTKGLDGPVARRLRNLSDRFPASK